MASTLWQQQLQRPGIRNRSVRKTEAKRPKKRSKRPPWDDTNSDLSGLKPSLEELTRRHQLHKPKPMSERKYLQHYQNLLRENKENIIQRKTIYQENVEKKKALIKEIFHHQEMELNGVLAETDRAMANVKDLFGDDPLKFRGVPHITDAPNAQAKLNESLLAVDMETPSRLNALSDSVMRHPALNDVTDDVSSESGQDDSDHDDDDDFGTDVNDNKDTAQFQSNFNLDYYKTLLQREQIEKDIKTADKSHSSLDRRDLLTMNTQDFASDFPTVSISKEAHTTNETLDFGHQIVRPSKIVSATNAQKSQKHPEDFTSFVLAGAPGIFSGQRDAPNALDKLTEMKTALDVLELELQSFESSCRNDPKRMEEQRNSKLDAQAALSKVLTSVVQYVKELANQMETDREMQQNLREDLQEQRALVDALTGDLICSQEQNELLFAEVNRLKSQTTQEITQIKKELQAFASTNIHSDA